MRIKLLLAYDGTGYCGWQIQEGQKGQPTIQSEIEAALERLFARKIRIYGSGRTDAGVHAHGQVAHFDLDNEDARRISDLRNSLNALLPQAIRILEVTEASANFDSRGDAIDKTYIYTFWQEPAFMPPYLRNFAWACGPLQLQAMRSALAVLVGEHDFASFQNSGTPVRNTTRRIISLKIDELPQIPFYPKHLPALQMAITANGFLKQMARNIAGCALYISRGKIGPQMLADILAACDRRALPAPTAPAHGLALAHVSYPLQAKSAGLAIYNSFHNSAKG